MKTMMLGFAVCLLAALSAEAQIPPDRGVLVNAEGGGQAMVAEMNGYPGPKHVLDLAPTLNLTTGQKKQITAIFREMESRAKELGTRIVRIEDELSTAFRQGLVSERSVKDDSEQIGRLRGRLRAVHLTAHLKTKEIMTRAQIELYKTLRSKEKQNQNK